MVKSIPLDEENRCAWDIHLIVPKRASLSPAARNFADFVRSRFAAAD